MVVADAGLLENRRAPATTLEGWRAFISADPSELALLTRRRWEGLGERDRRDYDDARIAHHAELVVEDDVAVHRPLFLLDVEVAEVEALDLHQAATFPHNRIRLNG